MRDKWSFLQDVFKMSALLGNFFSNLLAEKCFTFPRFSIKNLYSKLNTFYLN